MKAKVRGKPCTEIWETDDCGGGSHEILERTRERDSRGSGEAGHTGREGWGGAHHPPIAARNSYAPHTRRHQNINNNLAKHGPKLAIRTAC